MSESIFVRRFCLAASIGPFCGVIPMTRYSPAAPQADVDANKIIA